MGKLSKFQLIIFGIFAAAILVGVIFFSLYKSSGQKATNVSVWGVIPASVFNSELGTSSLFNDKTVTVGYTEIPESIFSEKYVDALASGSAPDVVLVPHELILKDRNKFFYLPYDSLSERQFKDAYIEEGELFLSDNGILAIPFLVDPLIMFWNRDTFNDAAISKPPTLWSQFFDLSGKLTVKDDAFNITKTVAAMGESRNINNSKELVAALILQAGNPIVLKQGSFIRGVLNENFDKAAPPTESALNFYTQFSNPAKAFYSWNRSLPTSEQFFLSGDSAIYFGFASEIPVLKLKNPNLNFDIAALPQSQSGEKNTTFGKLYSFAVARNTPNVNAAYKVIFALSSKGTNEKYARDLSLAPARRDSLSNSVIGPFEPVIYQSALWSKGWIDPDKNKTAIIFQNMIEAITSGRSRIDQAISEADKEIDKLLSSWN